MMTFEWQNDGGMTEWGQDGCDWNWAHRMKLSKSRLPIGRELKIEASDWSRGPPKKSKGLTLIRKCPSFHRHSLIQTSFNGQSCHSGMRISGLEWWDDAELTWMSLGWAHSIVMPSFQCHPIILVAFHHSKHSKQGGLTLASLRFQKVSPPNPLCRGGWVDWLHA